MNILKTIQVPNQKKKKKKLDLYLLM